MKPRNFIECPFCGDGVARKLGDKYQCTNCGIVFYKIDDYSIKIIDTKSDKYDE